GSWSYDDYFKNADKGKGITIADLEPVKGSLAETKGAFERIAELLNGDTTGSGGGYDDPRDDADTPTDGGTEPPKDDGDSTDNGSDGGVDTPVDSEPPKGDGNQGEPTPDPKVGTIKDAAYSMVGAIEVSSRNDVIEIAPSSEFNLETGTLALTFEADDTNGRQGLLTKDASYYAGGGNHLAVYLEGNTLKARFQDGKNQKVISYDGVKANKAYDVQITFDGKSVEFFVNGKSVGDASFGMSWASNNEYLQIGGLGWGSKTGSSGFGDNFDGTISDVVIIEGVRTPAQIEDLLEGKDAGDNGSDGDGTPTDGGDTGNGDGGGTGDSGDNNGGDGGSNGDNGGSNDGGGDTGGGDTGDGDGSGDQGDPTTGPGIDEAVYALLGPVEISSKSDVIEVAPSAGLKLDTGTVALTFEADDTSGRQGILTKDASYYAGGGNHLAVYLEGSTLKARFQDGQSQKIISYSGIKANEAYDIQLTFDGQNVELFVNGASAGQAAFGMTWANNNEYMQIGGLGWGSKTGASGFKHTFDGTISDVVIVEGVKTPAEISSMVEGADNSNAIAANLSYYLSNYLAGEDDTASSSAKFAFEAQPETSAAQADYSTQDEDQFGKAVAVGTELDPVVDLPEPPIGDALNMNDNDLLF
ncbi:MAG: LamG-like jellyroll fold domain-containing protein, partial [Paracoccaceae bacterium]